VSSSFWSGKTPETVTKAYKQIGLLLTTMAMAASVSWNPSFRISYRVVLKVMDWLLRSIVL
jgi:hypothetical protein